MSFENKKCLYIVNSNRAFHQLVKNRQYWDSALFKVKIIRKQKLHGLVFQGENNHKTFLKCQVGRGNCFKIRTTNFKSPFLLNQLFPLITSKIPQRKEKTVSIYYWIT